MANKILKSYRVLYGDTQTDLAEYLGISLARYNLKENGSAKFTLEEAKKISDRYGKKIEDIFFAETLHA